jgi:anti-sigma-K factor RskA
MDANRARSAEKQLPASRRSWNMGSFGGRLGLVFGLLVVIVVLALGVTNIRLAQRLDAIEARVPENQVHIVRMKGTENAVQSQAYLVTFPGESYGTLVVHDAPPLDPSNQYQIWLIRDGKRTSGGVFSVDQDGYGTLMIDTSEPLDSFQSFGVTIEPAGGSPGPTGKKILGGDL